MMTEAVTAALAVNELDEKELECVTGGAETKTKNFFDIDGVNITNNNSAVV